MMFAMYTPRATASVFAWALLIPILSHLLLGRRLGLSIAILFMSVTVVLFLYKYHDNPALMQVTPLANLSILSLVILALSHAYEVSRERSEHTLYHMAHTDFLTGWLTGLSSVQFLSGKTARAAREPTLVRPID